MVGERHEVVECQVGRSAAVDAAVVVSGVDTLPLGGADREAGALCWRVVAGVVASSDAAWATSRLDAYTCERLAQEWPT